MTDRLWEGGGGRGAHFFRTPCPCSERGIKSQNVPQELCNSLLTALCIFPLVSDSTLAMSNEIALFDRRGSAPLLSHSTGASQHSWENVWIAYAPLSSVPFDMFSYVMRFIIPRDLKCCWNQVVKFTGQTNNKKSNQMT